MQNPPVTLAEYQRFVESVMMDSSRNIVYVALGDVNETGELLEHFVFTNPEVAELVDEFKELAKRAGTLKKKIRDEGGSAGDVIFQSDPESMYKLISELGDGLWYKSAWSIVLDAPLRYVAEVNHAKLSSRKARGVIGGSGDER